MKTVKEVIEFIERERAAAEESGLSYTTIVLGELKEKIEGAVGTEANNPSVSGADTSLYTREAMELPVKIGDEVYAVLMPTIPELDGPAQVKPWRVYGVGVNKDGVAFVVNEFEEIYKLDDEDEGLSFSTREKAEEFLQKIIGNSEE